MGLSAFRVELAKLAGLPGGGFSYIADIMGLSIRVEGRCFRRESTIALVYRCALQAGIKPIPRTET